MSTVTNAATIAGPPALIRGLGCLALLSVAVVGTSCGGGSDAGVIETPASFTSSGSEASSGFVRFAGAAIAADRVRVDVEIGGETIGLDLYAFAFDIVLGGPSPVAYRTGSAWAGNALVADPDNGESGPTVSVFQDGERIVVGVTKVGGDVSPAGNDIPIEGRTIVSLELEVFGAGTTTLEFGGSSNPADPSEAPAAIDSFDSIIEDGVSFDDRPATVSR